MLYGAEKAREMGRSILPSTRQSSHADQHRVSRAHRHRASIALKTMAWNEDGWLDDQSNLTSDRARQADVKDLVYERRSADKVAPVMRWADDIVADLAPADRRAYVARLMPQNIVGWHAMTHIERTDTFDIDPFSYSNRTGETYAQMKLRRRYERVERWCAAVDLLRRLVADGRLKALNSTITSGWKPSTWTIEKRVRLFNPPRLPGQPAYEQYRYAFRTVRETFIYQGEPRVLKGARDIEAFLVDLASREHKTELDRLYFYLNQVYDYAVKAA